MGDYVFTIRFDDENHSLSETNGIPIDLLGEMLISLKKAIAVKPNENLTLKQVKGNCYALDFCTSQEHIYQHTIKLHKEIAENSNSGFNEEQRRYADKLYGIISLGYKINVYNKQKTFNYSITPINVSRVESYFEVGETYGKITFIGSSNLETPPSIKLSKEGYAIRITKEQESALLCHYKKERLLLTLRKKINRMTNRVESVELVDFEMAEKGDSTLVEALDKLKTTYKKRGLFPKVADSTVSVRKLRGCITLDYE